MNFYEWWGKYTGTTNSEKLRLVGMSKMDVAADAFEAGFLLGMNLSAAVEEAGGSVQGMENRFREGMTMDEFMEKFARTNGIVRTDDGKFKFIDPE